MARAFCPNCGTEFETTETRKSMIDVTNMDVCGTLIPKEIHNNNINKFEEKKENKTMNMNNFDMEALAKMVAAQLKSEVNEVSKSTMETKTVDGGQWAKNSKFYGKEICGYAYNPYLVRRWLPRQFTDIMKEFKLNVNEGIRCKYDYMQSISYLIEECEKLGLLRKKDKIAYAERSQFWSVKDCKAVFTKYANDCLTEIEKIKSLCGVKTKKVKIPKYGEVDVKVTEVIENHKIVLKVELDSTIETELELLKEKLEKCHSYIELARVMRSFKLIPLDGCRTTGGSYDYVTKEHKRYYVRNYRGYDLSKEFMKGFKKSGAYYTLKNFIMFDGWEFKGMTGRTAVTYLRSLLDNGTEDYVFYAMLKEAFAKNRKYMF